jgi:putative oxidoreductase
MKSIFVRSLNSFPTPTIFNWAMLLFRVLLSIEMIRVHGFRKLGIGGVSEPELIPNPYHLPEAFNDTFVVLAILFFPMLVLCGFCTRLATIPTLVVTLTCYFILHSHDSGLIKDTSFMYSLAFFVILMMGAGKYSVDNYMYKKL